MKTDNRLILPTLLALSLAGAIRCPAQTERKDSLRAAMISADKRARLEAGSRIINPGDFHNLTTATGEGDAIKFIQTLPGVSTGAEGSSAYYVRGGNLGGNLMTIDGVPVYGGSHLLGFSSAYSPDIVSETHFQTGGFTSEEGNLTSSHIRLVTKDGSFERFSGRASASNFLLGGSVSGPLVRDRLSFIGSLRASPVGAELSAVKGLTSALDSVGGIRAVVYDAYGKLKWRVGPRQSVSLSVFSSLDSYGYSYGSGSDNRMRWSNLIVKLSHEAALGEAWSVSNGLSVNRFSNYQAMRETLGAKDNSLAVLSSLDEATAQSTASGLWKRLAVQGGVKLRYARFSPGASSDYSGGLISRVGALGGASAVRSATATAHLQAELSKKDAYLFRAVGRLNLFRSWREGDGACDSAFFTPEASLLARVNLAGWLGVEATADWTAQHYHTLEGIPLGWSLDMTVPSDADCPPERASQYYAGVFLSSKTQRLSVGVYWKRMSNLTYFADATQIFSSVQAGWRDNIKVGSGSSRGLELIYEMDFRKLSGRAAYTLSKTDRLFEGVNGGAAFPAKFDRRHILNLSVEYAALKAGRREAGVNAFFTYQSGHWATVPAGEWTGELPAELGDVTVDYHTSVNNWEMPPYIRLDAGAFLRYGIGTKHPGTLNLGIFNVLNRHNPYSVTFNANERKWKQMSIFPIMPSLSWSMEF